MSLGVARQGRETTAAADSEGFSALQNAIQELAAHASIELSPKEALQGVEGIEVLPAGTRAFITRLPKGSFEQTLAAAANLHARGFSPVPHVTARTVPDAATLDAWLRRFVEEAGVQEILLVAGSNEAPEGAFADTLQIFKSGILENSGLKAINVAGHPEGHPQASEDDLRHSLDTKNEFAARTGLPVTLVTQFFFDAAPVIAWEQKIRRQGNLLPIDPGLHGVTGVGKLLKHAIACGVGASTKVLSAHAGSLFQLAQIRSPESLVYDLAYSKATDAESLFRNLHFFPLGGFAKTAAWSNALKAGRFSVAPNGKLKV